MTDPKYTATILLTDDGTDDVHVKCEFSGDGATDDSAAHRTAVVMMRNAMSEPHHDELVEALKRARDWIEIQMVDKGWPIERVRNPPEGSHLDAIYAALAKVGGAAE